MCMPGEAISFFRQPPDVGEATEQRLKLGSGQVRGGRSGSSAQAARPAHRPSLSFFELATVRVMGRRAQRTRPPGC